MWYRVWQFWQIVAARPFSEEALAEVSELLTQPEIELFQRFDRNDQWHSYRVMKLLQSAGHDNPDLLVAALLHDVGKTQLKLSVWQRSLIVLGYAFSAQRVAGWGAGEAVGWKRPFVVKAQHPVWGAAMAAEAGTSTQAVSLIRRHQDKLETAVTEEDKLLQLLQWADDQS